VSIAPRNRESRGGETRSRVYEAAIAEFRRVGFAAARVEKIVADAGVARGTFYFHFPSKEHVLMALRSRYEEGISARLGEKGNIPPRSLREILTRIVEAILEEVEAADDADLMREILSLQIRQPTEFDFEQIPMLGIVTSFFEDAAERGEVRDDIPPLQLTRIFLTCLFGFMLGAVESPSAGRTAIGGIINVFLRGISP